MSPCAMHSRSHLVVVVVVIVVVLLLRLHPNIAFCLSRSSGYCTAPIGHTTDLTDHSTDNQSICQSIIQSVSHSLTL